MRIIGGTHNGHHFYPPKNIPARPTTDLAKEALFNILNNLINWNQTNALDLFSGTGSISYELASRGCLSVTAIELHKLSIQFINQTNLKLNLHIHILKTNAFQFITNTQNQYQLIFADPPYQLPNLHTLPNLIFQHNLLAPNGYLIIEHNFIHNFDNHTNFIQKRNYGDTTFSFFQQKLIP